MKTSLTEQLIACIQETSATMNDRDQRSAIGMADQMFPQLMKNRDDLAVALVELLRENDKEQCKEALAEARRWLNAPFTLTKMSGQQEKDAIQKPKGKEAQQ